MRLLLKFPRATLRETGSQHWKSAAAKLRIVLKVEKSANGYAAKFDSLDQGATDLPIDSIVLDGNKLTFSAAKFGITYEGTLNETGDEIAGTFKQGAGATPLVFKRIAEVPKLNRPQDPKKPYPYDEEEVSYRNEKDNIKICAARLRCRVVAASIRRCC